MSAAGHHQSCLRRRHLSRCLPCVANAKHVLRVVLSDSCKTGTAAAQHPDLNQLIETMLIKPAVPAVFTCSRQQQQQGRSS